MAAAEAAEAEEERIPSRKEEEELEEDRTGILTEMSRCHRMVRWKNANNF